MQKNNLRQSSLDFLKLWVLWVSPGEYPSVIVKCCSQTDTETWAYRDEGKTENSRGWDQVCTLCFLTLWKVVTAQRCHFIKLTCWISSLNQLMVNNSLLSIVSIDYIFISPVFLHFTSCRCLHMLFHSLVCPVHHPPSVNIWNLYSSSHPSIFSKRD